MKWLNPYAVGAMMGPAPVARAGTAASFEPDCPSSPAFSAGGSKEAADSGSSPSAASSSSSSPSADHFSFITSRHHSPSTSPLCFGVGGAGRLLRGSSRALARASKKQEGQAAASTAPKGDVVGTYLRKISRLLRKAKTDQESLPPRGAIDGTARERAEAVASAIAHCKATSRRGASPPPPPSSPSLHWWLHDRQEEVMASAVARCNECRDSLPPPLRQCRDRSLLERHAQGTHWKEYSPCPPSSPRDGSLSTIFVAHGKESPHHCRVAGDKWRESATAAETGKPSSPSDLAAGELEMRGSFYELTFLKTFDGNEDLINRHFISVQI